MAKKFAPKVDVYQVITDKIITAIEAGTPPWVKPWRSMGLRGGLPYNAQSNRGYSGVNVWLLLMEQQMNDYATPGWMTFKQAKDLGGHVRKGEKSTLVVYFSTFKIEEEGANGETKEKSRGFMKGYRVFNIAQIDDLPDKIAKPADLEAPEPIIGNEDPAFDAWAKATGADIRNGSHHAAYYPTSDHIVMPNREDFTSADRYSTTCLHELGHWTGHGKRLDRDLKKGIFSKGEYAAEELVAELCSSFLAAELGLDAELEQSAAYIKSWLKALKNDKKFIFSASSKASKAAEYLKLQVSKNQAPEGPAEVETSIAA